VNQLLYLDGKIEIDVSQSVLMIELGNHHIFYGIMNMADKQLVKAGFYTGSNQQDDEALLNQVFEKHSELQDSFFQVIASFSVPRQLLIPEKFYQEHSTTILLDFFHGQQAEGKLISEKVEGHEFANVYFAPQYGYDWINRHFSNSKFFHTYNTGIRNIDFDDEAVAQLVVDFKPYHITVYVIKYKQLQLAQMFPYESPEDVVYYLAKICFQFGIQQNEVLIKVEGLVDAESPAYKHLEKYFYNIKFGTLPGTVRLHEIFNEHPPHFFSSLYKIAACVS
jgi:hypothetical protein